MSVPEQFQIVVHKHGTNRLYKLRAYLIYRSDQVIRFRLCAGDKWMIVEKKLIEKKWELAESSHKIYGDLNSIEITLKYIAVQLDMYLKGPLPVRTRRHPGDNDRP